MKVACPAPSVVAAVPMLSLASTGHGALEVAGRRHYWKGDFGRGKARPTHRLPPPVQQNAREAELYFRRRRHHDERNG